MTKIVNLLSWELGAEDDGPAGHRFRARSVGREAGASLTGFGVYELEPGEATWPYHFELTEEEWQRWGTHAERGRLTVAELAGHMLNHDANHIEQIRRILHAW